MQRAVARVERAARDLEQPEPVIEPLEQRCEPERRNARGGEFERERYTVEAAADFGDERRVCGGQLESPVGGRRPLRKQGDGRILAASATASMMRDREHRQPIHDLSSNTERGLARHQRAHPLRLQ